MSLQEIFKGFALFLVGSYFELAAWLVARVLKRTSMISNSDGEQQYCTLDMLCRVVVLAQHLASVNLSAATNELFDSYQKQHYEIKTHNNLRQR